MELTIAYGDWRMFINMQTKLCMLSRHFSTFSAGLFDDELGFTVFDATVCTPAWMLDVLHVLGDYSLTAHTHDSEIIPLLSQCDCFNCAGFRISIEF